MYLSGQFGVVFVSKRGVFWLYRGSLVGCFGTGLYIQLYIQSISNSLIVVKKWFLWCFVFCGVGIEKPPFKGCLNGGQVSFCFGVKVLFNRAFKGSCGVFLGG